LFTSQQIVELKEVLEMCRDEIFTVRKYAFLSLLAIFKDIIPGYRIRLPTEKEKQMKVNPNLPLLPLKQKHFSKKA